MISGGLLQLIDELFNSETVCYLTFILLGIQNINPKLNSQYNKLDVKHSFDIIQHPVLIFENVGNIVFQNPATLRFLEQFFPRLPISKLSDAFTDILVAIEQNPSRMSFTSSLQTHLGLVEVFVSHNNLGSSQKLVQIIPTENSKKNAEDFEEQLLLQTSMDELSYIISHDLVEPVRTIRSFSQIIKKSHIAKINDPEINEDFEFLMDASERLYNMIQGMLQYSRLSSKHFPHEKTDTLEVLVEVIKDLMAATNESSASIQCYNMPVINFNKTLLVQIFSNLIGNALKYKSENRIPKIEISTQDLGKEYLFIVQDNGIGIDNSQADRLFKIFQRLHPNDSKYPGTGMGLAICKKIIEREKGKIWFESTEGVGTKFLFTLPK